MNQLKPTLQSITYIITGELLQLAGCISDSMASTFVVILGIALFFNGLSKLKSGLDSQGQSGAGWLIIASIVGLVAAFIDLIPLMGVISSVLYMLCFVFHILGFMKLKSSKSIGAVGKSGISLLFSAMALAIIAAMVGMFPIVGETMGGIAGFGALVCALFGWLRIQEGIIEQLAAKVTVG